MSNPKNPRAYPSELTLKRQGAHVADWEINRGMSLRDYFAAKALPMCMTANEKAETVARMAYSMADAMLKEREK